MYSLFKKIISVIVVCSFSLSVHATFIKQEFDNFYLVYDNSRSNAFGDPAVNGNTLSFFPSDMSVSSGLKSKKSHKRHGGHGWHSQSYGSWATSIGIIPKEGFDASTLTLVEQGDYSYSQKKSGGQADYLISARIFLRSMDNPKDYEFLKLDEQFSAADDVLLEDWEVSKVFDLENFTNGFWLTIQNTLKVTHKRSRTEKTYASMDMSKMEGKNSMWDENGKYKIWRQSRFLKYDDELFLQKKYVGIEFGSTAVPLPASFWLFFSACGLLRLVKGRKAS